MYFPRLNTEWFSCLHLMMMGVMGVGANKSCAMDSVRSPSWRNQKIC